MPIARVQTPDGRIMRIEVPAGATNDEIQAFAESQYTKPETTIGQDIVGGLETAGTVMSGALAEPVAGIAGTLAAINPFVDEGAGARTVESVREAMTYQPRTEAGKAQIQSVGEFIQPAAELLQKAETGLGGAAFEATGMPSVAAAATAIPTALSELLGVAAMKGGIRSASKIKAISEAAPDKRISSILAAAEKADIPVLTTDIFPPNTFVGRTVQSISEKLGPLGSGSARASQQKARLDAVAAFADNIDIDTPFADSIVKSINIKSAKTLERAGKIRSEAVTKLDEFGVIPMNKTIAKIDEQIAAQQRLGAKGNQPLIDNLQKTKESITDGDFSLIKDIRTEVISDLRAIARSEDTRAAGSMQAVKSAMDKDMVAFARTHDKPSAKKWLASNRKFAEEFDTIKGTEIKRILASGEATPEKVIPILRGGKASELQRLHKALGPKGRDAAKGALIQQALKDAKFFEVDANPNPDALATALNRPAFQQASKVFFGGADKAELDGFIRVLNATRRAQSGQAVIKTGEQLLLPGGAGALGAGIASGVLPAAPTVAAVTVASAIAKAYESKAFRTLLTKISNTKKGSKLETRALELATPFVVGELQAAKTAQEETK